MMDNKESLTEEQRKIAADNHNLIYAYANKSRISIDDWYGVLAIGLCKAAKSFDNSKGEFSTLAFKCMDNEAKIHLKRMYKKSSIPNNMIVSYDSPIFDDESNGNLSIAETMPDVKSSNDMMYNAVINEFSGSLSERELDVFKYLIGGMTHNEIADIIGCKRQNVTYFVRKIRGKIKSYLSYK